MKTLQEKYKAILEGNFSKKQFVRDARLQLPQFITQFNGYRDTVNILKNKGILTENLDAYSNDAITDMIINLSRFQGNEPEIEDLKKILQKRGKDYKPKRNEVLSESNYSSSKYSIEAIERGVDYELEAMGILSHETVSEVDYEKAKKKAISNLEKDCNYYLHKLAGVKKEKNRSDKYREVSNKTMVDKENGLQKSTLKENTKLLKEELTDIIGTLRNSHPEVDLESIKDFIKMNYSELRDGANVFEKFENFLAWTSSEDNTDVPPVDTHDPEVALTTSSKPLDTAMDTDTDDITLPINLGDDSEDISPDSLDVEIPVDMGREEELENDLENLEDEPVRALEEKKDCKKNEMKHPSHPKAKNVYQGRTPKKLSKDERESHKKEMSDFNNRVKKILKKLDDDGLLEGRRPKMKGGKVVTENDYETGGYVESMGPRLDKAVDILIKVWEEWKNGPMTEPGMVPFAKKDLINYISNKLAETEEIEEDTLTFEDMENPEYLKESLKTIVTKLLNEEIISEAATGNLASLLSRYEDYNGLRDIINTLENIVTEVESHRGKVKDKIQSIFDKTKDITNSEGVQIGPLIAPAIESAFRKDLAPVSSRSYTDGITLPKTTMISKDEIEQLEEEPMEEKSTVFNTIKEGRRTKYTNRKKKN